VTYRTLAAILAPSLGAALSSAWRVGQFAPVLTAALIGAAVGVAMSRWP
jgi:hypothetical protein